VLTTFVIALREGLEASLIVGIVAAFLRQQGRPDALRAMWGGVGLAVLLCLAVGVALRAVDEQLPHRGQEGLATVIALVAVAMVTYMIVWMRRHARDLPTGPDKAPGSESASGGERWSVRVGTATSTSDPEEIVPYKTICYGAVHARKCRADRRRRPSV
jgi:high-affinity iron transporter